MGSSVPRREVVFDGSGNGLDRRGCGRDGACVERMSESVRAISDCADCFGGSSAQRGTARACPSPVFHRPAVVATSSPHSPHSPGDATTAGLFSREGW